METPICIDMKEEPTAVVAAQQSHHRLFRRLRDGTKRDEFRWKSRDGYHKYGRKTWTWKYTVYNQWYKLYSRPLNGLVSRQKLTWKNTTKLLAKENVIPRSRSKIIIWFLGSKMSLTQWSIHWSVGIQCGLCLKWCPLPLWLSQGVPFLFHVVKKLETHDLLLLYMYYSVQ